MGLQKAKLFNVSVDPETSVDVLFNPTEYGIDRGATYAELAVPGLKTPILQFIRGEAQTLNLELFLDRTDQRAPLGGGLTQVVGALGGGADKRGLLDKDLEQLRQFVQINGDLHAPPVCRFEWGTVKFQGVVTSLKEKHQLFDESGQVLRARVTLTLKSYEPVEVQLRELRRSSPDRTRVRVVREGERLDQLANEAYGNPRLWRVIAEANGIDHPRFLAPGMTLQIPAL
jgi:hypothetical protein